MLNDENKTNNNMEEPENKQPQQAGDKAAEAEKKEGNGGAEKGAEAAEKASESANKKSRFEFTKKRSFRFGSMATAFTAVFVAIVILINVGLTIIAQKYPISVDLTKDKNYNLSQQTIEYIQKLKQPITIKVFATKSQMEGSIDYAGPMKIIEKFPQYSDKISIQYIDYDKNPTAVAAYNKENINQGDIVVSATDSNNTEHYKHILSSDLLIEQYNSSAGKYEILGNKAEQEIDNAIDYVTSTDHPKVLFTEGHDEANSTSFQSLLRDSNYEVESVNTATSAIDENADALVIVAPSADFSSTEIDKIDKFLKNDNKFGKNIFIFLDPRCPELPNLEEYITEWGVKVEKGVIYDNTNSFGNKFDPVASSVNSDVVGDDVSTDIGTDVRIARPLTTLFDAKGAREVKKVIQTGASSQLLEDISGSTSSSDKAGPYTAMTLTTWSSSGGTTLTKSNMIVSGSYEILDNDLLTASNKNNSKVLISIANKLMEKEATITVPSKYNQATSLSMTLVQRGVVAVIFILIIPLAILIAGLVTWLRRRHL